MHVISNYYSCMYHKSWISTQIYMRYIFEDEITYNIFIFTVERESKVLSGKSLRNLSKLVPEGLTLAVHLDLPDSTITGLGFDAISNGLSMSDVTYKILLYWKRMCKDKKDGAVNSLTNALRDMGREEIANIVFERHRDNKELSPDAFTPLFTPYQ